MCMQVQKRGEGKILAAYEKCTNVANLFRFYMGIPEIVRCELLHAFAETLPVKVDNTELDYPIQVEGRLHMLNCALH